jgi:hypothetical protein
MVGTKWSGRDGSPLRQSANWARVRNSSKSEQQKALAPVWARAEGRESAGPQMSVEDFETDLGNAA